mmetsp:Transcript_48407/g.122068  ORF Transcript_48407/g.122068 Transcript_48407/m.122068 type:complete len:850 (+) Transcript_48407:107-2656(+)
MIYAPHSMVAAAPPIAMRTAAVTTSAGESAADGRGSAIYVPSVVRGGGSGAREHLLSAGVATALAGGLQDQTPPAGLRAQVVPPKSVTTSVVPSAARDRLMFEDRGRRKSPPPPVPNPLTVGEMPADSSALTRKGRPYTHTGTDDGKQQPLSAQGNTERSRSTSFSPGPTSRHALYGGVGSGGSNGVGPGRTSGAQSRTRRPSADSASAALHREAMFGADDATVATATGGTDAPHRTSSLLTAGLALREDGRPQLGHTAESSAPGRPRSTDSRRRDELLGLGVGGYFNNEPVPVRNNGVKMIDNADYRGMSSNPDGVMSSVNDMPDVAMRVADMELRSSGLKGPSSPKKRNVARVIPPWADDKDRPVVEDATSPIRTPRVDGLLGSTTRTARKNETRGCIGHGLNEQKSEQECAFRETGLPSRGRRSPRAVLERSQGARPFGTEYDMPSDMPHRMISAPAETSAASRAAPSSTPRGTPPVVIPLGHRGSGCGGGATLSIGATLADGLQPEVSWEENHKVAVGMQRKAIGECSLRAAGDDSLLLDSPYSMEPVSSSLPEPSTQSEEPRMEVQVVTVYSSKPSSACKGPALTDLAQESLQPIADQELHGQSKASERLVFGPAGQRTQRRSSSAQPHGNRLGLSAGTMGARAAALSGGSWAQATGRDGGSSSLSITGGSGGPTSPRSRTGNKSRSSMALPTSDSTRSGSPRGLLVQPRGATRALSADTDRSAGQSLLLGSGTRARPSLASSGRPSLTPSAVPCSNTNVTAPATIWNPSDGPKNGAQHRRPWQDTNSPMTTVKSSRQIAKQWQSTMGQNLSALRSELDSLKTRDATASRRLLGNATQAITDKS